MNVGLKCVINISDIYESNKYNSFLQISPANAWIRNKDYVSERKTLNKHDVSGF